jgi:pyruvate formate lyase activating enzyme
MIPGQFYADMAYRISKRDFLRYSFLGMGASMVKIGTARNLTKGILGKGPALSQSSPPPEGIWKWSKESPYYVVKPQGVQCQICPNRCTLKEGDESVCRARTVYKGKLYSIAYGNPCSIHIDPIEKKPLFHFLPATRSYSLACAGCTLSCLNCQNWEISQKSPKETENFDMMPDKIIPEALDGSCKTIAFTYSEPTAFYEYMYDIATRAKAQGLKNLLISNGYINEKPLRDLSKVIHAANINLKSFSQEIYATLNGGSLQPILNTLKTLKEEGVWLEITNLVIPNWTDKIDMIRQMCDWLVKNGFQDNPLHFNRFFPLYKLTSLPYTPLSILDQAREVALKAGMHFVYIGNVPETYAQNTYCPKCKKAVVERKGFTVLSNNLKGSSCKFCGQNIPGVWS